jgi:hypothetical protein
MKRNFISVTVFVTSLILTPVIISPLNANNQVKRTSISSNISKLLQKRGIQEDAAQNISKSFVGDNEELFSIMVRNLENGCSILNSNEILDYLSNSALHKKEVNLTSYASLVGMVQKIKKHHINRDILKELEKVSNKNSLYINSINA